ncbi:hypothetical protein T265_05861 [Opisthorchis viverrini]|uniref:Uncharacterized protein n=1 Tax=Opisthorchis viverrini TaxID=6198 RepID=A0A075AET0_OPIVI|nr:hypothetical protein T265_05861 [Opisthorchis viverrini]KER27029.1 hypothetical protein T265_05861 [Opisthorchis viverrini]
MKRPGEAHSFAWKHQKREIQLGSSLKCCLVNRTVMHIQDKDQELVRLRLKPKRGKGNNSLLFRFLLKPNILESATDDPG